MPKNDKGIADNTTDMALIASGAMAVLVSVYEYVTGIEYSAKDRKKLEEVIRIYQENFQLDVPPNFVLDEQGRPTCRVKNHNWPLYIDQLLNSKRAIGFYYYQSRMIAAYAATYLSERSKRWFAKGTSGDLIEQVMADWINFALNDLLTLRWDDESIKKIEQRIKYIEDIQKDPTIFQFGFFTRKKNVMDTLLSIKLQLETCRERALEESMRQCARDKFEECRSSISALLFSAVQTIYYARSTEVYGEPFELSHFIDPENQILTTLAKDLYPIVKSTRTGEMLHQIISLAGLESFGTVALKKVQEQEGLYFTENFKVYPINWEEKKESGLPPWVSPEKEREKVMEFQLLGESILRVSNLKHLIEEAYDLTGKMGDSWAYGDKYGKLSLNALLFLLEKELNLLKKRYDDVYKYHNNQRQAYTNKYKINAFQGLNLNFNEVDKQKNTFNSFYHSIKSSAQSIQEQMKKVSLDSEREINNKKKDFYFGLIKYFRTFYPAEIYNQYMVLEQAMDKNFSEKIAKNDSFIFSWPLKMDMNLKKYFSLKKPEFQPFFQMNGSSSQQYWKLGGSYDVWIDSFFIRNHNSFSNFQELASTLELKINTTYSLQEIQSSAQTFQLQIKNLKQQIENERPAWRFKWGMWPIRTKGWPFNRKADQFANLLLNELNNTALKVERGVYQAANRIERYEQIKSRENRLKSRKLENTPEMNLDSRSRNNLDLTGYESYGFLRKRKSEFQVPEPDLTNDLSGKASYITHSKKSLNVVSNASF